MAGEGREAHLDRLPVADVGEHLIEDREGRSLGRRPEPGLVQQRGEPERLQRHRLAARVRAAEHERAQPAEVEVDRHGRLGIEERMARRCEPHLVRDLHGRALPAARERAERQRQVDPSRRLDRRGHQRRGFADGGRQLAQDPLDLLALGARRLGLAVRELDDVERLDEERLARVGGVVDDPGHAAAGARLDGEHGPPAAEGDEVLLQVLAQVARADELLELVADALTADTELAAELAQLRGRVVAQVGAVLLDRPVDRLRDRSQRGIDRRRDLPEERRRRLVERTTRPQRARRGVGDVPQRRG